VDKALCRQLEVASRSQTLVLMGDFTHPSICWRNDTAGHQQLTKFPESIDDNFLAQVTEEVVRTGALLDLTLTSTEELVGDMKVEGSFGCSDH